MRIVDIDRASSLEEISKFLAPAIEILQAGGLVAFPTETVYGLGADIFSEDGVRKIYEVKHRSLENPLTVHISSVNMMKDLIIGLGDFEKSLISAFWPGPLTIILRKSEQAPTFALKDTIAFRMPRDSVALALIEGFGKPIYGTSANLSGGPSPTRAAHVIHDLGSDLDLLVRADTDAIGLESTVLDCSKVGLCETNGKREDEEISARILRPGVISAEDIYKATGKRVKTIENTSKRYAPKAQVYVYRQEDFLDVLQLISKKDSSAVLYFASAFSDCDEEENWQKKLVNTNRKRKDIHKRSLPLHRIVDEQDYAQNLYLWLREYDELGIKQIYLPVISSKDVENKSTAAAIMNRITKMGVEFKKP